MRSFSFPIIFFFSLVVNQGLMYAVSDTSTAYIPDIWLICLVLYLSFEDWLSDVILLLFGSICMGFYLGLPIYKCVLLLIIPYLGLYLANRFLALKQGVVRAHLDVFIFSVLFYIAISSGLFDKSLLITQISLPVLCIKLFLSLLCVRLIQLTIEKLDHLLSLLEKKY